MYKVKSKTKEKTYVVKNSNQHHNLMFLLTYGQSCYLSHLKWAQNCYQSHLMRDQKYCHAGQVPMNKE